MDEWILQICAKECMQETDGFAVKNEVNLPSRESLGEVLGLRTETEKGN